MALSFLASAGAGLDTEPVPIITVAQGQASIFRLALIGMNSLARRLTRG